MEKALKREIMGLIENAKIACVSSVDAQGYPNTKAMLSLQHEGLGRHYFSTNLSAKRTQQFLSNLKASIYFCDEMQYRGLQLIGEMEVCTDKEHRTMLWREGFEMYYPNGIEDDDYCVLKFTAHRGNYYHNLTHAAFSIKEFEE